MKPGKSMNDSAHGIPDTNMKLDEEGGPHKHPDQVLDQPAYVSKSAEATAPSHLCNPHFTYVWSVARSMPELVCHNMRQDPRKHSKPLFFCCRQGRVVSHR